MSEESDSKESLLETEMEDSVLLLKNKLHLVDELVQKCSDTNIDKDIVKNTLQSIELELSKTINTVASKNNELQVENQRLNGEIQTLKTNIEEIEMKRIADKSLIQQLQNKIKDLESGFENSKTEIIPEPNCLGEEVDNLKEKGIDEEKEVQNMNNQRDKYTMTDSSDNSIVDSKFTLCEICNDRIDSTICSLCQLDENVRLNVVPEISEFLDINGEENRSKLDRSNFKEVSENLLQKLQKKVRMLEKNLKKFKTKRQSHCHLNSQNNSLNISLNPEQSAFMSEFCAKMFSKFNHQSKVRKRKHQSQNTKQNKLPFKKFKPSTSGNWKESTLSESENEANGEQILKKGRVRFSMLLRDLKDDSQNRGEEFGVNENEDLKTVEEFGVNQNEDLIERMDLDELSFNPEIESVEKEFPEKKNYVPISPEKVELNESFSKNVEKMKESNQSTAKSVKNPEAILAEIFGEDSSSSENPENDSETDNPKIVEEEKNPSNRLEFSFGSGFLSNPKNTPEDIPKIDFKTLKEISEEETLICPENPLHNRLEKLEILPNSEMVQPISPITEKLPIEIFDSDSSDNSPKKSVEKKPISSFSLTGEFEISDSDSDGIKNSPEKANKKDPIPKSPKTSLFDTDSDSKNSPQKLNPKPNSQVKANKKDPIPKSPKTGLFDTDSNDSKNSPQKSNPKSNSQEKENKKEPIPKSPKNSLFDSDSDSKNSPQKSNPKSVPIGLFSSDSEGIENSPEKANKKDPIPKSPKNSLFDTDSNDSKNSPQKSNPKSVPTGLFSSDSSEKCNHSKPRVISDKKVLLTDLFILKQNRSQNPKNSSSDKLPPKDSISENSTKNPQGPKSTPDNLSAIKNNFIDFQKTTPDGATVRYLDKTANDSIPQSEDPIFQSSESEEDLTIDLSPNNSNSEPEDTIGEKRKFSPKSTKNKLRKISDSEDSLESGEKPEIDSVPEIGDISSLSGSLEKSSYRSKISVQYESPILGLRTPKPESTLGISKENLKISPKSVGSKEQLPVTRELRSGKSFKGRTNSEEKSEMEEKTGIEIAKQKTPERRTRSSSKNDSPKSKRGKLWNPEDMEVDEESPNLDRGRKRPVTYEMDLFNDAVEKEKEDLAERISGGFEKETQMCNSGGSRGRGGGNRRGRGRGRGGYTNGIPNSMQRKFPDKNLPKEEIPSVFWMLNNYFLESKQPKRFQTRSDTDLALMAFIRLQILKICKDQNWSMETHLDAIDQIQKRIKESNLIATAIVDFLSDPDLEQEPADMTYSPPAPIMTSTVRKVFTLIVSLEKTFPDVVKQVQDAVEYKIFRLVTVPLEIEQVETLSSLYVAIARFKKDRAKVRLFCIDALYCFHRRAVDVIFMIIQSWPDFLPNYETMKESGNMDMLAVCTMCMINNIHDPQGLIPKLKAIKTLLRQFHKYPSEGIDQLDLVKMCLEALKAKPKRHTAINTALILMAKQINVFWAYKYILKGGLMQMIINRTHPCTFAAFDLLGNILRSFPTSDVDRKVTDVMDQLCDVLDAAEGSPEEQESIVRALLCLSRHDFYKVMRSVLKWKPLKPLREDTVEKLENNFRVFPQNRWKTFVINDLSKPYANQFAFETEKI